MVFDKKYKFSETWFDINIPLWDQLFEQYSNPINSVLEVGCFEGRATVYLCEKVLKDGTNYDVVDTFGGTEVETGMGEIVEKLKSNPNELYNTFTHNISFHNNINFTLHKGYSQNILPELVEKENKYDLIYIDASHRADDTFVDAYFAHKMLNSNGIIIFDDYGWKDPNLENIPVNSPEFGVRVFMEMYKKEYHIAHIGYQVVLIKH